MWQLIQDNFISNYHEYLGDLHHMLVALSKIQTFVFSWTPLIYTMVTWNINIMLFIAITALVHVTRVMAREMQGPDVSIVRGCG